VPETKLAVYVTAHTVKKLVGGALAPERALALLYRLGVEKVYLENYRDGLLVPPSELEKARKLFEGRYEVAGGSCIGTWGEGWGRYADYGFRVVCLTDERNLELLARAMRELGSVFEEALIDDFWAQWCTCSYCVERFNSEFGLRATPEALRRELARGDTPTARMWARFSTELLSRVSRGFVAKPFREAGGRRLVLKVAEWREDFYVRGLFLPEVARVFDGVYVGSAREEEIVVRAKPVPLLREPVVLLGAHRGDLGLSAPRPHGHHEAGELGLRVERPDVPRHERAAVVAEAVQRVDDDGHAHPLEPGDELVRAHAPAGARRYR